jgi:hypothetical protein
MSMVGAEIIAIDNTDFVGLAEDWTTLNIGEFTFSDVQTFVDGVLAEVGSRTISLLHIQVHGSPNAAFFGSNRVDTTSFAGYQAQFSRLRGKFNSGAWVDLRACLVGQNLPLLRMFHNLWNVGIVAGRGLQNNIFDMNQGRYQLIYPSGREDTTFFVPSFVEYSATRRAARALFSRI